MNFAPKPANVPEPPKGHTFIGKPTKDFVAKTAFRGCIFGTSSRRWGNWLDLSGFNVNTMYACKNTDLPKITPVARKPAPQKKASALDALKKEIDELKIENAMLRFKINRARMALGE
jgi:hypothetical protein